MARQYIARQTTNSEKNRPKIKFILGKKCKA